jgi:cystathionine beta-synthase
VVRDRISKEKLDQLLALGVDVLKVDTSLPPEHPDSYNNITPRLARELPHCYFPDQHNNRENNDAHYFGTGREIWEQMDGRIDAFIAGMGTGGTVGGVGRYLKERDPKVKVVAVDVVGRSSRTISILERSDPPHPTCWRDSATNSSSAAPISR